MKGSIVIWHIHGRWYLEHVSNRFPILYQWTIVYPCVSSLKLLVVYVQSSWKD